MRFRQAFTTVAIAALLPLPALADELSESRVKELVLEAIRENPEIVMEAVAILEQRQAQAQELSQAQVLNDQRDLIENDPNAPVLGNAEGDVTVVEFFDYNCPYCRRVKPEGRALTEDDPNIHWAMMGLEGRAEEASVLRVAEEIGLDIAQLRKDMEAPEVEEHIATSMQLTQALGFNGTPSFVIGDALVPGFVEKAQLVDLVEEARKVED